ncbi:hypothetical protein HXX76_009917 [Chlamydomonas incerta]|uniref:phytol kinase n=1 Tax=Chlamydomonas incerta TaxID=51695 RepID=A0A835VZ38_CHLIN|nr:hypothetical protein HXX76_009917 [Chlamydomonas incerta]|eukprot:KAG2430949.1 hypothetical protein HXX76_009917 [Chlamydomonas incerta]
MMRKLAQQRKGAGAGEANSSSTQPAALLAYFKSLAHSEAQADVELDMRRVRALVELASERLGAAVPGPGSGSGDRSAGAHPAPPASPDAAATALVEALVTAHYWAAHSLVALRAMRDRAGAAGGGAAAATAAGASAPVDAAAVRSELLAALGGSQLLEHLAAACLRLVAAAAPAAAAATPTGAWTPLQAAAHREALQRLPTTVSNAVLVLYEVVQEAVAVLGARGLRQLAPRLGPDPTLGPQRAAAAADKDGASANTNTSASTCANINTSASTSASASAGTSAGPAAGIAAGGAASPASPGPSARAAQRGSGGSGGGGSCEDACDDDKRNHNTDGGDCVVSAADLARLRQLVSGPSLQLLTVWVLDHVRHSIAWAAGTTAGATAVLAVAPQAGSGPGTASGAAAAAAADAPATTRLGAGLLPPELLWPLRPRPVSTLEELQTDAAVLVAAAVLVLQVTTTSSSSSSSNSSSSKDSGSALRLGVPAPHQMATGPSYSLHCALDAGLMPALELALRAKTLSPATEPAAGDPAGELLLVSLQVLLRSSGTWPALLAHGRLAEAAGLAATLMAALRRPGRLDVATLDGLDRRGCCAAALLEQLLDVMVMGAARPPAAAAGDGPQVEAAAVAEATPPGGRQGGSAGHNRSASNASSPLWFNNSGVAALGADACPRLQLADLVTAGGAPPAGSAAAAQQALLALLVAQSWMPLVMTLVARLSRLYLIPHKHIEAIKGVTGDSPYLLLRAACSGARGSGIPCDSMPLWMLCGLPMPTPGMGATVASRLMGAAERRGWQQLVALFAAAELLESDLEDMAEAAASGLQRPQVRSTAARAADRIRSNTLAAFLSGGGGAGDGAGCQPGVAGAEGCWLVPPAEVESQLQAAGVVLCGNPTCSSLDGPSSALIQPGRGKTCSRCRAVRYCCGACQLEHWVEGGHARACAEMAATRS